RRRRLTLASVPRNVSGRARLPRRHPGDRRRAPGRFPPRSARPHRWPARARMAEGRRPPHRHAAACPRRRVRMKAAILTGAGLEIRDVPRPEPKPHEVLVRVRASGLNRADLLMAAGRPHGNAGGAGAIAGLEWAGEVAAVGREVRGVKPGDRVMCSGNGGYAEYAVTDAGRVSPIPANNMSYEQAATLPVALQT